MTTAFPHPGASDEPVDLRRTAPGEVPLALARLAAILAPGAMVQVVLAKPWRDERPRIDDVVAGAAFEARSVDGTRLELVRVRSLADTVAPGMRLLVCGLNPSLYAADAGVAFARPGNRFWPAARAAGLAEVDRDARHALEHHGLGFTDLVKRATRAAAEVRAEEYVTGLARVERMVRWLQPGAVCLVGLDGWRRAGHPGAVPGWQDPGLGGRPTYLMPSTSGLNASSSVASLTAHLRTAAAGPPRP